MSGVAGDLPSPWQDALVAASMLAVDPHGLAGIRLRARHGPVRDRWLEIVSGLQPIGAPFRRVAAGVTEARLAGGLDIGATIECGRPVLERGVLAAADGGMLVVAMAERLDPAAAAVIGMAMDDGEIRIERDGVSARQPARFCLVALDEGVDDEGLAASLADRLGLRIDLDAVALRDMNGKVSRSAIDAAKTLLPSIEIGDGLVEAVCAICLSAGLTSMRPARFVVRAARIIAALRVAKGVEAPDVAAALRLGLGLRLAAPDRTEAEDDRSDEASPSADEADNDQGRSDREIGDMLLQAAEAVLPQHLLSRIDARAPGRQSVAGKAGAIRNRARRGRAVGSSDRPPVPGARLDVLSTLRQAAPWQRTRKSPIEAAGPDDLRRLRVLKSDFRYTLYREKAGTTAIFAVDASGSAAVERLAETKGAIELLLAECYVRRDQVALLAFRGRDCETLLEPTRSLVRAKRSMSALPGGGGTPLAAGILATLAMATAATRRGQSVVAVFMTDGRGNVALDGGTARERVAADTEAAARLFRGSGVRSMVIDTGQRPKIHAEALSRSLGAGYLLLPRAGSRQLAQEIGARMEA